MYYNYYYAVVVVLKQPQSASGNVVKTTTAVKVTLLAAAAVHPACLRSETIITIASRSGRKKENHLYAMVSGLGSNHHPSRKLTAVKYISYKKDRSRTAYC